MAHKEESNSGLLKAVVAGAAAIGAGVVAAKVLSNEDNREKIKEVASDVKAKFMKEFEELRTRIEKSEFADKFQSKLEELQDKFKEMKEAREEDASEVVEKFKEKVEDLKASFTEAESKAKDKVKEVKKKVK